MPESEYEKWPNDWAFLKPAAQAAILFGYVGAIALAFVFFRGNENFTKILTSGVACSMLLLLLGLRFSKTIRKIAVRPDDNDDKLLRHLVFPILLWIVLSVVFLLLPAGIL